MPDFKTLEELRELFAAEPPEVSFEFFPPKTDAMDEKLWDSIRRLEPLSPRFVSVTYGAGGSTRERTHQTVTRIARETTLAPAAHLTCVNASREEINAIAERYWESGIRHIVALRGDSPDGPYAPHPEGYAYADDLVKGLRDIADFEISVAAYPEGHPEARSKQDDIDHLKRKVDAGATRAITQYFFDVELYLRFLDKAHAAGIDMEITPGILPITNVKQMIKFSAMCGTDVPAWLRALLDGLDDNPDMRHLIAIYVAAEQCRLLRREGIHSFHFYTLNRARLTTAICRILGIRANVQTQPVDA